MFFKRRLAFMLLWFIDTGIRPFMGNTNTHKALLTPGIENLRWRLGLLRAWHTFELSAKKVPAYKAFLHQQGFPTRLTFGRGGLAAAIASIPEMDKNSYIKKWSIPERSWNGKLPRRGVVVDESSGSSGTPTSWVRGKEERAATRHILQVGYARTSENFKKQPFVLNAFALGAWATGMNVTASLTDVTMIKSTGPDKNKVISTMREFGPNYTYVIISYPPFLKALFDDDSLPWAEYDIVTAFGGEGISENMRDHILKYAHSAFGSYGASDLEINFAIETEYTIALRRAIAKDPVLAKKITKKDEYGVLPMIFQYNPFAYVVETNEHGELVVSIVRNQNINPRIRYNIHDRGHVMRVPELTNLLKGLGHEAVIKEQFLDLPLIFHYGRSDMSIDYNGSVLGPDVLRDIIYKDPDLLEAVENHRLISYENEAGNRSLHIALQLTPHESEKHSIDQAAYRTSILADMQALNWDFKEAIRIAPENALPTIAFYDYRTGPFVEDGRKLKNEYVWQLEPGQIDTLAVDLTHRAER